jgi:hypothetical protein
MPSSLMMSGFDLRVVEVPDHARIVLPARPQPALDDPRRSILRALEEPVSGPPLADLLEPQLRVAVVLDDLSLPVPPPARDCRRDMLEVVLEQLAHQGVRPARTTVLVANGLSRQWRPAELAEVLGPQATASHPVTCHDAESTAHLARVGEVASGPVELHRAVVEADLVIHLNVVTTPAMAGAYPVVSGILGYRTVRHLVTPAAYAEDAPLLPGSALARAHEQVAELLFRRVQVIQLSAVLSNELWAPALAAVLQGSAGMTRPLQMWNALPAPVRHRAARLLKSSYRPTWFGSGPPGELAPRALSAFKRQHEVSVDGEADVLLFGLPDQGPSSVRSAQNPVLAAQLALGYVAGLFTGKPLLRQGGAIVFANPLTPAFDRRAHAPHEEFYEKVLRMERDPQAIHEKFEPYFAGRPEFVAGYERRFAFHGAHPLHAWYQCGPARRRAARIFAAHGDPRACARLGFTPANSVEDALVKAKETVGKDRPDIAILELPPPFWVKVG